MWNGPRHNALPLGIIAVWLIHGFVPSSCSAESDQDFFENRIRPLLLAKCDGCHSTARGKTSGGLALDTRNGWDKGGDSGPAIVPGKPDESLLIQAIQYRDGGPKMPPRDQGGKLKDAEIELLVEWVKRGAPDPRVAESRIGGMNADQAKKWWAFQPLLKVAPPAVKHQKWSASPIDQFVAAAQEQRGIEHLGAADKRTLIRRASFDLTGLPPTPDEIDAFLKDESDDAFARVIDRLLSNPAYGERWGRHWLDVARYADTAGDGADYPVREAGKYRNWVVRSFNADQPFDEFVREQIAGDIIAQSGPRELYADRVLATGFLAIGKRYGYAPNPDYQHLDFADAIDSVGRSLLGMSIGCARCHDHKYDPVTAADYYALYGIFQSTKWSFPGGEEFKRPTNFPPLLPPSEVQQLMQVRDARVAEVDAEIAKLRRERATLDGRTFAGGIDLGFESQTIGKPPSGSWFSSGPNTIESSAQSPFAHVHPAGTRGVRIGTSKPTDGVRYVFETPLKAASDRQIHFTLDFRTVAPANAMAAYRLYLGRGVIASQATECSISPTEFAVKNGAKWEVLRKLEPGTWYTLRLTIHPGTKTCSGVVGTASDLTSFDGLGLSPGWDGIIDTFICDGFGHIAGDAPHHELDNIGLQESPFAAPGTGPVVPPMVAADAPMRLAQVDQKLASLAKQRESELGKELYEVAYGVSEGNPTNAKIQKRGEPDQLADEVPRRFLEVLGGDQLSKQSSGSGRLELANWLTRPSNPLTARVFVNRVWQWHFGRGLVSTASDFGTRGELPTHPELLDWLTADFIASGWSVKSLHRQIMLSQTYQLSSDDDQGGLKADLANQFLWRYSRRALDAEAIRDAMLAVSDRLDRSIPVKHPFPAVDTWGFTIHQPFHAVYDSDHRSLYLMIQRNRRHPFLALFDAADPNLSVAERQPTITPTQTLFLMNSPFVHQQAAGLARRLISGASDESTRIRLAFELAHGKTVSESELNGCRDFMQVYAKQFEGQNLPPDQRELAVWGALARVLLTSNAFLYVD